MPKTDAVSMVDIIDENDVVIETLPRGHERTKGRFHRFVHIMVFDEEGHLIIQKRASTKTYKPGLWDVSAGGHVDAGETYETAAARELFEELGIRPALTYVCDNWAEYGLCKVFEAVSNGPFTLSDREIERLEKLPLHALQNFIQTEPESVMYGFKKSFEFYCKAKNLIFTTEESVKAS